MATRQLDWIHPSVRDVVIEYLMNHDVERQRFLKTADSPGLVLALSSAGGREGERSLPFLRNDRDWDVLQQRYRELACELGSDEQLALMRGLLSPLLQPGNTIRDADQRRIRTIAAQALEEIRSSWDARSDPLRVRTLEAYYELSVSARIYVQSPQLARSWDSVIDTLRQAVSSGRVWSNVSAPKRLLDMVDVLAKNEPRFLRVARWPHVATESLEAVLEAVDERSSSLPHLQAIADEWIEINDNGLVEVPVEPSQEEEGDTEWLDSVVDVLQQLSTVGILDQAFIKRLDARCTELLDARQERKRRWDEEGPHSSDGDDDRDEPPRTQGAGDFDLDDFFSDL